MIYLTFTLFFDIFFFFLLFVHQIVQFFFQTIFLLKQSLNLIFLLESRLLLLSNLAFTFNITF